MLRALASAVLCLIAFQAIAADEVFVADALAIRGYDPVAYFTTHEPVMGDPKYRHEWNGVAWQFASRDNLERFKADPARFAPQFGGFCAFGMSRGYKVGTDPAAFTIHDGKLYLNYSLPVRATWLKDTDAYVEKARGNWTTLEHEPYER
jgi:YHS domain-containing protein